MVLAVNNSDSFPGAEFLAQNPVTSGECCLRSTIAQLAAAASAAGRPYTIKGATLFIDGSQAQIDALCLIGEPDVTGVNPDPIVDGGGWQVLGTNFGVPKGEVWLGSAATWAGSGTRVEQSVSVWDTELIAMNAVVLDGLPTSPGNVYVYVVNDCVERNAVGFETEVVILGP